MTLNDYLTRATKEEWAIGHFNFSTLDQLAAIVETAQVLKAPVMVGTSEGERDFIGLKNAVALIGGYQKQGIAVFLNADHTKSIEKAKEAVDTGYESVHIDLSEKPFEENIEGTRMIVEYARKAGGEISVEGELGVIRGSSQVRDEIINVSVDDYTSPEEAKKFIEETGVSRLAIMVGNVHGIFKGEPELDIELIAAIRAALPQEVVLVLHAGSGIEPGVIQKAVAAGIANVHVSTELRRLWREELESALEDKPDEYAPYKLLASAKKALNNLIQEKIQLFGSSRKAD